MQPRLYIEHQEARLYSFLPKKSENMAGIKDALRICGSPKCGRESDVALLKHRGSVINSKSILLFFFVYSTFVTTQKKAHGEAMNRSLSCAVGFVSYCFFYSFPSASSR